MGMFDSVYVTCPDCGEETEHQTKNGLCQLAKYEVGDRVSDRIPTDVGLGVHLQGGLDCDHCSSKYYLTPVVDIVGWHVTDKKWEPSDIGLGDIDYW